MRKEDEPSELAENQIKNWMTTLHHPWQRQATRKKFVREAIRLMREAGVVNAIRDACRTVGTWDLSDCVMYTSCQRCPMRHSTADWARLKKIYSAAAWEDDDDLLPNDTDLKQDLEKPISESHVPQVQILREEAIKVWDAFRLLPDGARY